MQSFLGTLPHVYAARWIKAEREGDKARMKEIEQSVPAHLKAMVGTHIRNHRERMKYAVGR